MGHGNRTAPGAKKVTRFPENVCVKAPRGTRERLERAAAFEHQAPAEWLRAVLRRALDASRKRQARRGAK